MPALVAGIHVFLPCAKDVDGRDKPGHDEPAMERPALVTRDPVFGYLKIRLSSSRNAGAMSLRSSA